MTLTKKEKIVYAVIAASVFLVLLTFMILVLAYFPYKFKNGDGSQTNPYLIETFEDLKGLSDNVNNGIDYDDKYFKITKNIPIPEDFDWQPIGNLKKPFKGFLDGSNYEILNLNINKSQEYCGLFGVIDNDSNDSAVKDLKVSVGYASLKGDFKFYGCFAGFVTGNIANIKVNGGVKTFDNFEGVGLLVGRLNGTARNCLAEGSLEVVFAEGKIGYIGGAFGVVNGSLYNCNSGVYIYENNPDVSNITVNTCTGGIVGYVEGENRIVDNCISYLFIKSIGNTGGIVCKHEKKLVLSNCKRLDNIECTSKGDVFVGGVLAFGDTYAEIINCENLSMILVNNKKDEITESVLYVGGILASGNGVIRNCVQCESLNIFTDMSVVVGGLVGKLNGNIYNSYVSSNIQVVSKFANVSAGGMVGVLDGENNVLQSGFYNGVLKFVGKSIQSIINKEDNVGYLIGEYAGTGLGLSYIYYSLDNYNEVESIYKKPSQIIDQYVDESIKESLHTNQPISLSTLKEGDSIEGLNAFISDEDVLNNKDNVWVFREGDIPNLYYQEVEE